MSDMHETVENPRLIAAVEAFFQEPGRENEQRIEAEIQEARYLVPTRLEPDGIRREPVQVEEEGVLRLAAFTDLRMLRAWQSNAEETPLTLTMHELADLCLREETATDGFLLNPGTHNLPVPGQALAKMAGQVNTYTLDKKAEVLLTEPVPFPQALADAIKKRVKKLKAVKKVWMLKMSRSGEESYLVVLEFEGDRDTVIDAIGKAAMPQLRSGEFVDIVSSGSRFGRNAVRGKAPFYKRGWFR